MGSFLRWAVQENLNYLPGVLSLEAAFFSFALLIAGMMTSWTSITAAKEPAKAVTSVTPAVIPTSFQSVVETSVVMGLIFLNGLILIVVFFLREPVFKPCEVKIHLLGEGFKGATWWVATTFTKRTWFQGQGRFLLPTNFFLKIKGRLDFKKSSK